MRIWFSLALVFCAFVPVPSLAQRKEITVLFKDGFRIFGKVVEPRDGISDPGGAFISIPASGTLPHIDDQVRTFRFPYSQVQDVIPKKPEELKDLMVLKRLGVGNTGDRLLKGWEFETVSPWNNKWERTITVVTSRGRMDIDQRITLMTPHVTKVLTLRYDWAPNYLTKEMGPDLVRSLLVKYFADKKELKEPDKRLHVAKFLYQAGWYDYAERELEFLVKEYPDSAKAAEPLKEAILDSKANLFVDELDRAKKVGQHATVLERLDELGRDPETVKRLSDKNRSLVQDVKNGYEAAKEKIDQAKQALKHLPTAIDVNRGYWQKIAYALGKDLNYDTVGQLETFTTFAQQYFREVKDSRKPTQKAEEVMALAVTGWLQGNSAAEPDVKLARQLWSARTLILDLQKTDGPIARKQMADSLAKEAKDVPIDMLARLIKMLPPPAPPEAGITEVTKLDIEVPDGATGSYYVHLPRDYHHHRAYPVLLMLHSSRDKPADMIQRFTELANINGFILAAPIWGKGLRPSYSYSAQEHVIVLDTLRDLRRRFQVDSDRAFLMGWEEGGAAAYDIGLSHPDQFAGILPMNGKPQTFSLKYHTNAQYLPFYVVDGDQNGSSATNTRAIFKDWVRWHYPCLYVEYKGRGSEWFGVETVSMFDWMERKKRRHPLKELGRHNNGGIVGEEFKIMRTTDNKFYWLSCEGVQDRNLNDHKNWDPKTFPATLTGSVHTGNELVVKGGQKGAAIWNQVNIRTFGLKNVTLWLTPNLIDYAKPLTVRVNGAPAIINRTITPSVPVMLEEFYQSGDRSRLVYFKLDFKL